MTNAAQSAILALDRDLAITEVQSMPAVTPDSLWRPRLAAVLIAVFAAVWERRFKVPPSGGGECPFAAMAVENAPPHRLKGLRASILAFPLSNGNQM